jgi:F0F1-type ATP synthase membrane subunit c/vacuolar-type H+-ATPase subunit K
MKNIIVSGLVAGFTMLIVAMAIGLLTNAALPSTAQEYENTNLFRAMSDPIMSLYFLYPFFLGIALAWVWEKTKGILGEGSLWVRGSRFARTFWVVSTLPGILMSYSTFPVSLAIALTWLLSSLVQLLCAGFIYARMNK